MISVRNQVWMPNESYMGDCVRRKFGNIVRSQVRSSLWQALSTSIDGAIMEAIYSMLREDDED